MAEFIFDDWFQKVEDLRSAIGKDLDEIRKAKVEMQAMQAHLTETVAGYKMISDPERIVISAPEVIIGNVDIAGVLKNDVPSHVVIRSNNTELQGVSGTKHTPGIISLQSSIIRQEGVDPGRDGLEHEVGSVSLLQSVARNVVISGSTGDGAFNAPAENLLKSGVEIHTDSTLLLDASDSVEKRKESVEALLDVVKQRSSDLEGLVSEQKAKAKALSKQLQEILAKEELLNGAIENDTRTNVDQLNELNELYHVASREFYLCMNIYMSTMSALVESKRKEDQLKKQKEAIEKKAEKFKEESTGASILVRSEAMKILSADGDGNLRENPGAGMSFRGRAFEVRTNEFDGSLMKDSHIFLSTENMRISTADPKRSDPEKADNSENPAVGNVRITSKNFIVEAVDYDVKDRKLEEKALTKDGRISLRAENIDLASTDTEGKAAGKLGLNAKDIAIRATDVKKEKGKPDQDDKLAAGGSLLLSAEKVIAGSKSKDNKTKTMQLAAEQVGLFADTTAEMQQGEGKAAITLDGGNANLGGSKVDLFGNTTIKGKADVKGELLVPKATADQVEAKSAFKSPNINDTMGAGVPGQAEKISAKLKAEEVKNE